MDGRLGLLAVIALGLALAGCDSSPDPRPSDSRRPISVEVEYDVIGSAPYGSLTYETPSGTAQQNDVDIPLVIDGERRGITYTFGLGDFVYLSVQNGTERGAVTCQIKSDGVVISTNTARGAYAIATCKSTAG